MNDQPIVSFTREEARHLFDILDVSGGGHTEDFFAWDGTNSLADPTSRALAKLFLAAGRDVPKECQDA